LAVQLDADLAAIAAATSVTEVSNIAYPPSGILFTGRGRLGAQDLNVSSYVEFNSSTITESETELYVPGTDIVIAYGTGVGGEGFDYEGDCFNEGDYVMQIRVAATNRVIAEFEVPLNPDSQNVPFNLPPQPPSPT
jgi:hypothetical protein